MLMHADQRDLFMCSLCALFKYTYIFKEHSNKLHIQYIVPI